jgi:hypothetical protein
MLFNLGLCSPILQQNKLKCLFKASFLISSGKAGDACNGFGTLNQAPMLDLLSP